MDRQECQHQQKLKQQQHHQPQQRHHQPQQQHHQPRQQLFQDMKHFVDMQHSLTMQHLQDTYHLQDMQHFVEMQHLLDRQNFVEMQHLQDRQHFVEMQHLLDRQHRLYMRHCLDMQHSLAMQLYQQSQMASQPQPQSRPMHQIIPQVPCLSHDSQGYTINYGTVLRHSNSSSVIDNSPSTSSADLESCTSQEKNRLTSDVQRDVHNERRRDNEVPDSSQDAVPKSIGQEGTVMANVLGTSTAVSCTSRGENNPIPDHQDDEAVNESRDVRISRQDVLKIRDTLLKLKSMVNDLRDKHTLLKHFLSVKSQEEDIESYLQEIRQLVQNNSENPALD